MDQAVWCATVGGRRLQFSVVTGVLCCSALSGCRHLARLDLSHNGGLSWRAVSALVDAVVAAGCPLTELGLAGCPAAAGEWWTRLAAPPLRTLTMPDTGGGEQLPGGAQVRRSPDGDLTVQLPADGPTAVDMPAG